MGLKECRVSVNHGRPEFEAQPLRVKLRFNLLDEVWEGQLVYNPEEMKGQPAYDDESVRAMIKAWLKEEFTVEILDFFEHKDFNDLGAGDA